MAVNNKFVSSTIYREKNYLFNQKYFLFLNAHCIEPVLYKCKIVPKENRKPQSKDENIKYIELARGTKKK